MKKNIKISLAIIFLFNFFALEIIKFLFFLYFIITDDSFYFGNISSDFSVFKNKILIMNTVPLVVFFLLFPIMIWKKKEFSKIEKIILFILVILFYNNFDIRDIFFFVGNHRIKLYISLLLSIFLFLLLWFAYRKYYNKRSSAKSPDTENL